MLSRFFKSARDTAFNIGISSAALNFIFPLGQAMEIGGLTSAVDTIMSNSSDIYFKSIASGAAVSLGLNAFVSMIELCNGSRPRLAIGLAAILVYQLFDMLDKLNELAQMEPAAPATPRRSMALSRKIALFDYVNNKLGYDSSGSSASHQYQQ